MKMWGGRFAGEPDDLFLDFSRSIDFDVRLYPYDITCTRAWAKALSSAGIISGEELSSIRSALELASSELESGSFQFVPTDEDIHTAIERRLVEIAGKPAGKVRTGRSRNDQVATDMRLFVMDECPGLSAAVTALQAALLDKAVETVDIIVPGHTHLQQAQPVLLAHVMLAFVEMLERDLALVAAAKASADSMPLGSAALAGTTVGIDRESLASDLGFSKVSRNSIDAVSDRDFAAAALFACSMVMAHLSRLAEEAILWVSSEWGLAALDDAWSTGSSLMPQKKNPDGAELVRGKAGRVFGSLVAALTVIKGLPLSYNRDLQEDKEGLFDAVDTTRASLAVMAGTLGTMKFDPERARELSSGGFMTATDLADFLSESGMDFPEAHRITGEIVTWCLDSGKDLDGLTASDLVRFSDTFTDDALGRLAPRASVERRDITGGTASGQVRARIEEARARLS